MKRELIQNVKVLPYTSGSVIDRAGFLSAIIAAEALAAGNIKVAISHCDTKNGTFEPVPDEKLFMGGSDEATDLTANDIADFDVDLIGCKQFIKVTLSGTAAATGSGDTAKTAACAVVLGDTNAQPV